MFHFDKNGRPKTITAKDLEPKVEDIVPNYKEIMDLNSKNFNPKPPNPHDFQHKEGMNNNNSGFKVLGEKDKLPKKKDCNSECPRTTSDKKMSQKGIDFLKGYESEVKKNGKHVLYDDDLGFCTIGYGHLVNGKKSCKNIANKYKNKYKNGLSDTKAKDLLKEDIESRERAVNKKVKKPICQQEFDALLSLYYNIPMAFNKKYKLINKLNKGDYDGAKKEFASWRKGGGKVLSGLVKRRKAEMKMFECGIYDSSH